MEFGWNSLGIHLESARNLVGIWSEVGRNSLGLWSEVGQNLVRIWLEVGQNSLGIWLEVGWNSEDSKWSDQIPIGRWSEFLGFQVVRSESDCNRWGTVKYLI